MKKYRVRIKFFGTKPNIDKVFYNKTSAIDFYNSYSTYLAKQILHFNGEYGK